MVTRWKPRAATTKATPKAFLRGLYMGLLLLQFSLKDPDGFLDERIVVELVGRRGRRFRFLGGILRLRSSGGIWSRVIRAGLRGILNEIVELVLRHRERVRGL